MYLNSLALLAALLPSAFGDPKFPDCPAYRALESYELTPEGVGTWLRANGSEVKTVEQFVCCLPKVYRENFLISPSSIAGQSGSPESPRVIMHPGVNGTSIERNTLILSINGGADYLSQPDSVEMAFFRKSTEKLEYVDVSLEGKKPLVSPRNPGQCMQCHGADGKEPPEGAKAIFDPFGHWPRFVGGARSCNPVEDELQRLKQKRSLEAIRDNPRFKCLDHSKIQRDLETFKLRKDPVFSSGIKTGQESLTFFDGFLLNVNSIRVARIIRATPDFEAYKYVLAALHECQPVQLNDWLPPTILREHTNLKSVEADIAHAKTPDDIRELIEVRRQVADRAREKQKAALKSKENIFRLPIEPGRSPFSCDKDDNRDRALSMPEKAFETKNPIERAYVIENALRNPPLQIRGGSDPQLRFLFEGRGISMENWGGDAVVGEYKSPELAGLSVLWKTEPKTSRLSEILALKQSIPAVPEPGQRQKIEKQICEELKKESLSALSSLPPKSAKPVIPVEVTK